ncbi:MAG: mannitol dehydrogenase family protein [Thermomicrobiales bacterium]
MTVHPLNARNFAAIAASGIPVPQYDRADLRVGIVHFGVGNFHRSHQAMYLDRLMNASTGQALDWAICGVGVLPSDVRMRDVLRTQDGLYTLVLKYPDGREEPRVIGSIAEYLFAPDDPEAVIARLADPAVRIVSLTVTEGGYAVNDATGAFDATLPAIAADLEPDAVPSTVFGLVTAGLARRRAAGVPPFTIMSCDNMQGNGHVAQIAFTSFARLKDPGLGDWIAEHVAFPNAMVDRITPATTDADRAEVAARFGIEDGWPVLSESFVQWVLEDRFPLGRPPYEGAGVQVVADVEPYELMKLRLLNASHQAMAYPGILADHTYVHEVCQQPLYADFLMDYMTEEGTPTLLPVPGIDLDAYRKELIVRFASPAVRDTLLRLAFDASERIPKFLLPVVRDRLAAGGDISRSALVIAAWAVYLEGRTEDGAPIEIADQRREMLQEAVGREGDDPLAFIGLQEVFGDLAADERFVAAYEAARASIRERGAEGAIAALLA